MPISTFLRQLLIDDPVVVDAGLPGCLVAFVQAGFEHLCRLDQFRRLHDRRFHAFPLPKGRSLAAHPKKTQSTQQLAVLMH
jgi:hypothetical protein